MRTLLGSLLLVGLALPSGGRGSKMPKLGTIHETDLAVLRAWIEAGAPK